MNSIVSAGGGLLVGVLVALGVGFAVRPGPVDPASVAAERPSAPSSPAVERVVRRSAPCPEPTRPSAEALEREHRGLEAKKAYLTGRIRLEVGAGVDPPEPFEQRAAVLSALEELLPSDARILLECDPPPCHGGFEFVVGDDEEAARAELQAIHEALRERYPASQLNEGERFDPQTYELGWVTTTFALEAGPVTAEQRRRIRWHANHFQMPLD